MHVTCAVPSGVDRGQMDERPGGNSLPGGLVESDVVISHDQVLRDLGEVISMEIDTETGLPARERVR
jgi:hypothetical protein